MGSSPTMRLVLDQIFRQDNDLRGAVKKVLGFRVLGFRV